MQTELFEVDPLSDNRKLYARAAEALGAGALVGIPTETVYGLGADALNPEAVRSDGTDSEYACHR